MRGVLSSEDTQDDPPPRRRDVTRFVTDEPDQHDLPVTVEQWLSEHAAAGDGTPEFRAWVARQIAKRGLG